MAFKNSQTGIPLMRPLFFEEPAYDFLKNKASVYLWGDDILVAPVFEKGQQAVEVYFPKTSNWYDAFGNRYKGGSHLQVRTRENQIPFFFRGGSFIPNAKEGIQSTSEYNTDHVRMNFIYDADVKESSGMLYDDDGLTADAYTKGKYEILHFRSKLKGNRLFFTITPETGKNTVPRDRKITFTIYNGNRLVDMNVDLKAGKEKTVYIKIPTR